MFQKLIEKILASLRKQPEKQYPFPTTRPEDLIKQEPILDPISKQTSQPESVNNQITDSVTSSVVDEPPKKKRTTKQNGSKTTKRKSK